MTDDDDRRRLVLKVRDAASAPRAGWIATLVAAAAFMFGLAMHEDRRVVWGVAVLVIALLVALSWVWR